jgi:streptogramin lyase
MKLSRIFYSISLIIILSMLVGSTTSTAQTPLGELGEPGTVFRYDHTYGETEVAYPSDTVHINYPWGLTTDGTDVWIGEYLGNRALKYTQSGAFEMQIGLSGYADIYDTVLLGITDVGIDNSGNIWLVDGDANHIVEFNSMGNKIGELGTAGDVGPGNQQLNRPQSIVFDAGGNVYVSDGAPWYDTNLGNQRIQIFDNAGSYLTTIGESEICGSDQSHLCGPRHITIHGNQLFIPDAGNHRVQIFDISIPSAPVYVATLGTTGVSGNDNAHFNNPSGVAVDANYIYVADLWNSRIQVFNSNTRAYVTTIGSVWGSGNNQFKGPSDVAIDASGYLYVADFVNIRVQQFVQNGGAWEYVRTFGVTGVPYITDGAHFYRPSGVAVSNDGSIYLTEENGQRLIKLNASGEFQWLVGLAGVKGDWIDSNFSLNNPADVALDSNGKVFVADRWHQRVQIYLTNGAYYGTISGLWCPGGVGIAPNNYIYIADSCQHTVQIYNTNLSLVSVLGESGVVGIDNYHFNYPQDVAIDSNGMIYVADSNNQRVQVYNSSRSYVRTMGETSLWGNGFNQFNNPMGLAVDKLNRLYVADNGNNRIQIFNSSGAYLTTIGGIWGNQTGQVQAPQKVGIDKAGNVYVADWGNHRIQKFAPGVPHWKQVNINGFGSPTAVTAVIKTFNNQLYAGTGDWNYGPQIWRTTNGETWYPVTTHGEGIGAYSGVILSMIEFDGNLYAGTGWTDISAHPEIWRSSNGTDWTKVYTGTIGYEWNINAFGLYNSQIYTAISTEGGVAIYRCSTGDADSWSPVITGGNGDINNDLIHDFALFNNRFYAVGENISNGAFVWKASVDGTTWTQVNTPGFDGTVQSKAESIAEFNGDLYVGTKCSAPTCTSGYSELWKTSNGDDWSLVVTPFENTNYADITSLFVFKDSLFAAVSGSGNTIWKTLDGTSWQQVNLNGWGDGNSIWSMFDYAITTFNDQLYIATTNWGNGAEIWCYLNLQFLPMIKR